MAGGRGFGDGARAGALAAFVLPDGRHGGARGGAARGRGALPASGTRRFVSTGSMLQALGITLGKVALFIALMLVVGRRLFPWILWQVAQVRDRANSSPWAVVAAAVGVAYGSSMLFGVSMALGSFFAGMVLRESKLSYRAAEESLPLRDAFSVLFFVSVGTLFDPRVLLEQPLEGRERFGRHPDRQIRGRRPAGARRSGSAEHGAHGFGRARPDRRILLHPCGPGRDFGVDDPRRGYSLILACAHIVHRSSTRFCSGPSNRSRNGSW